MPPSLTDSLPPNASQDTIRQQDWKIERLAKDNRALEAANVELRSQVETTRDENLQVRWRAGRGLGGWAGLGLRLKGCWPICLHHKMLLASLVQVSEKILALDEDNRALRLAAGEAASKLEALSRERSTLLAVQEELRIEVGAW